MYFKSIEIENVGPIDKVSMEFPVKEEYPLPVVIVGENGSGKSILLSYLVNSLVVGKQEIFIDTEVEKGKVYKYRSPSYIMSGKDYFYSSVNFNYGVSVQEWQLQLCKRDFEVQLGYVPARKEWMQIPDGDNSFFDATFRNNKVDTESLFKKRCCLYFPVNRFEEPAWLNLENLRQSTTYTELKHILGYSNRSIICTSPLKNNKNWLLDLIFDRQVFEFVTRQVRALLAQDQAPVTLNVFDGYSGQSTNIYEAVLRVLRVILREGGNIRLGAGIRKNRQIAVIKDERPWIPNLFQLSTGETQLLNLFVSIVRDYDLSEGELNDLSDIKGIVIIDEIDAHLHTVHQKEVLPELIASFPGIQFVITTHSPLFLMGMEEKFGSDGFLIYNMPNGIRVAASDFSEFTAAYEAFKETTRHREEIQRELEQHVKPVVFVEGDYDIRYLMKAAEILGKSELFQRVQLKDGNGFGGLDKIWKNYNNSLSTILPGKIILLYDCDTNKQDGVQNQVYRRAIPTIAEHPIKVGIENLFPPTTIEKLEKANPKFIDINEQSVSRIRGEFKTIPSVKLVNKDEKGNICNWLCSNGEAEDFQEFERVFNIIEKVINN